MTESNVPEEDLDGKKLTQNKNKILSAWKNQVQNNEKFQAELAKNPNFFEDLKQLVERLKAEITEIKLTNLN